MIPQDKLIHFLGCYLVCSMLISLIGLLGAITITALLGMAKEVIYDGWVKKGTPEIYDFVAYAVGLLGGTPDLQFIRVETQKLLTDYNPNAMIINGYWDGLDTYNGGDYK